MHHGFLESAPSSADNPASDTASERAAAARQPDQVGSSLGEGGDAIGKQRAPLGEGGAFSGRGGIPSGGEGISSGGGGAPSGGGGRFSGGGGHRQEEGGVRQGWGLLRGTRLKTHWRWCGPSIDYDFSSSWPESQKLWPESPGIGDIRYTSARCFGRASFNTGFSPTHATQTHTDSIPVFSRLLSHTHMSPLSRTLTDSMTH